MVKRKNTDIDKMKIEENKKAIRSGYDMEDYITTKLIESLFKFLLDRWVWINDIIKSL